VVSGVSALEASTAPGNFDSSADDQFNLTFGEKLELGFASF
jgi:hypothetical protein